MTVALARHRGRLRCAFTPRIDTELRASKSTIDVKNGLIRRRFTFMLRRCIIQACYLKILRSSNTLMVCSSCLRLLEQRRQRYANG